MIIMMISFCPIALLTSSYLAEYIISEEKPTYAKHGTWDKQNFGSI